MNRARAFLNGMREFRRSSWTTGYCDVGEQEAYDTGRELAHRLTFRHYEPF